MTYHIEKYPSGTFAVTRLCEDADPELLGFRQSRAVAQRLAESTAGRKLEWNRREDGVYIGA